MCKNQREQILLGHIENCRLLQAKTMLNNEYVMKQINSEGYTSILEAIVKQQFDFLKKILNYC